MGTHRLHTLNDFVSFNSLNRDVLVYRFIKWKEKPVYVCCFPRCVSKSQSNFVASCIKVLKRQLDMLTQVYVSCFYGVNYSSDAFGETAAWQKEEAPYKYWVSLTCFQKKANLIPSWRVDPGGDDITVHVRRKAECSRKTSNGIWIKVASVRFYTSSGQVWYKCLKKMYFHGYQIKKQLLKDKTWSWLDDEMASRKFVVKGFCRWM